MNKVSIQASRVGDIKHTVIEGPLDILYLFESKHDNALVVSDGHHTFDELYNHRFALFCALTKVYHNCINDSPTSWVRCWKSKFHSDGTMFEGWFIAGLTLVEGDWNKPLDAKLTHMTYHLPLNWWDKFDIQEVDRAPEWDGHTSNDVIERLLML